MESCLSISHSLTLLIRFIYLNSMQYTQRFIISNWTDSSEHRGILTGLTDSIEFNLDSMTKKNTHRFSLCSFNISCCTWWNCPTSDFPPITRIMETHHKMCTHYKSIEEFVWAGRKYTFNASVFYGQLQFLFHFEYWGTKNAKRS